MKRSRSEGERGYINKKLMVQAEEVGKVSKKTGMNEMRLGAHN